MARVHDLIDRNFNSPTTVGYDDVILLPDGKILARSGSSVNRLNSNGSIDSTFTAITASGISAKDMKVDSLGRIVLGGQFFNGTVTAAMVRRYLANGAADTSFSGDGAMTFLYASNHPAIINSIAIDNSNRIVVAGEDSGGVVTVEDVAVARINTSGALDNSFDGDGIAIFTLTTSFDGADDMLVQSDGKILLAGYSRFNFFVMRLDDDGSRDQSFAGNGYRDFSFGVAHEATARAMTLDSAGRIVIGGRSAEDIVDAVFRGFLARLTTSGEFDTTFGGGDGIAQLPESEFSENINAIQVDSAGNILTLGSLELAEDDRRIILRKFSATGGAPNSLASDGLWISPLPDTNTSAAGAHHIGLDAEGAIYVTGGTKLLRLNVQPAVVDFEFRFETGPQHFLTDFNDDIGTSLADGDLLIRNLTTNAVLSASGYDTQAYDRVNNTSRVNFNSIIADGNYRVTYNDSGIENNQLMNLAGNRQREFFFLNGDANRDRAVNINDFAILAARFNLPGTFSQGNFNYAGNVDISDFAILASQFNKTLPAPADLPRASIAATSSMQATKLERQPIDRSFDFLDI